MRIGVTIALVCASAVSPSCSEGAGTATKRMQVDVPRGQAGSTSDGQAGAASALAPDAMPAHQPNTVPSPQLNAASVLQASCATATVQAQLLPANLLFVLDRSGSMNCNPPPTTDSQSCESDPKRANPGGPSKWEITQHALITALKELPPSAHVGISYFSSDDTCGVSATPSVSLAALDDHQLAALESSLGSVKPNGGTPLVGATILAYQHLHALALANEISGNSFVVLLTDGEQSDECSDPSRCDNAQDCTALLTEQEVPKAAGPGADIRTFVIGAPGSEPARPALSQIALNGGTAPAGCDAMAGECHFDMTRQSDFAAALSDALATIGGKAVTCELPLPASDKGQPDLALVNVVYTAGGGDRPRVIPHDVRAACDSGAEGWQYNPDSTKIELCGAICDAVRTDDAARLDIVVGCPAEGPI